MNTNKTALANEFHNILVEMHRRSGGPRFRKMLTVHGGVQTAVRLTTDPSNRRRWWNTALTRYGNWFGLEQTVVKARFRSLFPDIVIQEAKVRVAFMKLKHDHAEENKPPRHTSR